MDIKVAFQNILVVLERTTDGGLEPELQAIRDEIAKDEGQVTADEAGVALLAGRLTAAEALLSALQAQVGAEADLSNAIDTLGGRITVLEDDVGATDNGGAIFTRLAALENGVTSLSDGLTGAAGNQTGNATGAATAPADATTAADDGATPPPNVVISTDPAHGASTDGPVIITQDADGNVLTTPVVGGAVDPATVTVDPASGVPTAPGATVGATDTAPDSVPAPGDAAHADNPAATVVAAPDTPAA